MRARMKRVKRLDGVKEQYMPVMTRESVMMIFTNESDPTGGDTQQALLAVHQALEVRVRHDALRPTRAHRNRRRTRSWLSLLAA
jgi:hypothetical protein